MSVYLDDGDVQILHGDCREVMADMADCSVDAVITDPPYGLEFMGRDWDAPWKTDGFRRASNPADAGRDDVFGRASKRGPEYRAGVGFHLWCESWAAEALRVLKPGGHLAAFGGTRTYHRLAAGIEDAGFEIRDTLAWMYGSGFPKSLDVSEAIDKRKDWKALPLLQARIRSARATLGISQSEAARRVGLIGPDESLGGGGFMWFETGMRIPTAEQYRTLRDVLELGDECDRAFEAAEREVLSEHGGTTAPGMAGEIHRGGERTTVQVTAPSTAEAIAWQGWGTALKPAYEPIVLARKPLVGTVARNVLEHGTGALNIDGTRIGTTKDVPSSASPPRAANAVAFGAVAALEERGGMDPNVGRWPANVILDEEAAAMLDEQTGDRPSGRLTAANQERGGFAGTVNAYGSAERGGSTEYEANTGGASRFFYTAKASSADRALTTGGKSDHPTVKPVDVMRWLVRLLTPPAGLILDPFLGSGTTAVAARLEGFRCIGIEQHEPYAAIAADRLSQQTLLGGAA